MTSPLIVGPATLRETVEFLASHVTGISLTEWDIHSNRILAAARQLSSPEGPEEAQFPRRAAELLEYIENGMTYGLGAISLATVKMALRKCAAPAALMEAPEDLSELLREAMAYMGAWEYDDLRNWRQRAEMALASASAAARVTEPPHLQSQVVVGEASYATMQAQTPICRKCGQIDVRIPRLGIYHVCPESPAGQAATPLSGESPSPAEPPPTRLAGSTGPASDKTPVDSQ